MKSPQDKNVTLLQFIVNDVCEHAPELCGFVQELEPLENAASVALTELSRMVQALEDSVADLIKDMNNVFGEEESDFLDSMAPFLQSAELEVEALSEDLNSITLQAADVLALYGEDLSNVAGDDPLQSFFSLIINFVKNWNTAHTQKIKDDEAKKRKEELKKKEEELKKKEEERKKAEEAECNRLLNTSFHGEAETIVITGRNNRRRRMSVLLTQTPTASDQGSVSATQDKDKSVLKTSEDPSPCKTQDSSKPRASPSPLLENDSVTALVGDATTRRRTRSRQKRAVSTTAVPPNLDDLGIKQ